MSHQMDIKYKEELLGEENTALTSSCSPRNPRPPPPYVPQEDSLLVDISHENLLIVSHHANLLVKLSGRQLIIAGRKVNGYEEEANTFFFIGTDFDGYQDTTVKNDSQKNLRDSSTSEDLLADFFGSTSYFDS
jgi:hypothetical protein